MGSAGLRLASTSGPLDLKSVLQTLAYLFTSIEFPSECVSDRTVVWIGDKETSVAAWSRSRGRCSSPPRFRLRLTNRPGPARSPLERTPAYLG
jgi:hypothetical protein